METESQQKQLPPDDDVNSSAAEESVPKDQEVSLTGTTVREASLSIISDEPDQEGTMDASTEEAREVSIDGDDKSLVEIETKNVESSSQADNPIIQPVGLETELTPVPIVSENRDLPQPIAKEAGTDLTLSSTLHPQQLSSTATGIRSMISVVPTGFDQQVSPTFLKEKPTVVTPGIKDSDGFLPPPPASTLLIRRARVSSTGASTYVVSKCDAKEVAVESDASPNGVTSPDLKDKGLGGQSRSKPVRRKPGRPVGSTCKYKKSGSPSLDGQGFGEVRVSARSSSSIFKHDGSSPAMNAFGSASQWIFPLPFRPPHISGGKPPMSGHIIPYSKVQKKDRAVNIDPLTGKRKYTKRNKIGMDKKQKGVSFEPEPAPPGRPKQHLSDNGVWRPTDDFRLIVNTTAVEDLEKVYVGVKFSCYFTYKEIEDRWRKLLYGEKSSLVSQNAISALHPQVKAMIYAESLFSPEEEKLIASVKNVPLSNPDISAFQTLLDANIHVFNKHRTAKNLMMHWLDMRDFNLLPDQDVMEYSTPRSFEDFEEMVVDEEIQNESNDDAIAQEIKNEDRSLKKKIRIVEDEITAWQLLIDQIMDDGRKDRTLPMLPTEFDNKTYAILRGLQVLYVMTSREITIGRSSKESKVDADLTQEGSSNKISRKQAIIKLKDMGKFVIINKGRHPIFVDRKAVSFKCAATLHDQSVIQIAHISLIFLINEPLIEKLVDRDVRREVYSSFKDLEIDLPPTPSKTGSFAYPKSSPTVAGSISTTPQSRNPSIHWGYPFSIGSTAENPSSITSLGVSDRTRTDLSENSRYTFSTALPARSPSTVYPYQPVQYGAPIQSSSRGIISAVGSPSPLLMSNISRTTNEVEAISDPVDVTSIDVSTNWEPPVSSLTQCSIGQMSGSVSFGVPQTFSEEVVSQTRTLLPQ